jgi:hypothetical protein
MKILIFVLSFKALTKLSHFSEFRKFEQAILHKYFLIPISGKYKFSLAAILSKIKRKNHI